jgi:hypothetical protein
MHLCNSYRLFSKALRMTLSPNPEAVVNLEYNVDNPDTILDSGYISYLIREISLIGQDTNVRF